MLYNSTTNGTRIINFSGFKGLVKISDEVSGDCSVIRQISFSTNGVSFTDYMDLSELPIVDVDYVDQLIYYRYKISVKIGGMGIGSYTLNTITIANETIEIDSMELASELSDIITRKRTPQLYDPYKKLSEMTKLYDEINGAISDVKGFDAIYFRTESDYNTESITFKTYRLNNVVESKNIRLVIKGNELPDDLQQFNQFGWTFQDELIVHITKEEFVNAFGSGMMPNSNDYFYLPLTDRVYQVNSPKQAKEFVQHASFWEMATTKYEKRASVKNMIDPESDEFHQIDDLIGFTHDYKADKESDEQFESTKPYNDPRLSDEPVSTDNPLNEVDVIGKQQSTQRMYYMFDYSDVDNTELVNVNELKPIINEKYQVSFIVIPSTGKKLMELTSTQYKSNIIFKQNQNGFFVETNSTVFSPKPIKQEFNILADIDRNKPYGVVLTIDNSSTMTIDVEVYEFINRVPQLITEKTFLTTKQEIQPTIFNIYGGLRIGMLRLTKGIMDSESLLTVALPDSKDFVFMKNATPQVEDRNTNNEKFYNYTETE